MNRPFSWRFKALALVALQGSVHLAALYYLALPQAPAPQLAVGRPAARRLVGPGATPPAWLAADLARSSISNSTIGLPAHETNSLSF